MRRVKKYGMLNKNFSFSVDGISLIKSTVKHHLVRNVIDHPRIVDLEEVYKLKDDTDVDAQTLEKAIADGSYGELFEGRLEL